MTKSNITYAPIIPLIGGEPLGAMNSLSGQLPEYVLSYSPFAANDKHYIKYLREKKGWDGEYVFIDENTSYKPKAVDVVMSTCPCAGLSALSTTSGGDSAVNDWMFKTASYVLEVIKPKVFWGENAPRLYSLMGRTVADKLYKIAAANGYTLTIYATESRLHGLSQKRPRTFYFFTRDTDGKVPIIPRFNREPEPIEKIFAMPKIKNDHMDIVLNHTDPSADPWICYCMHVAGVTNIKDYYNQMIETETMIHQTRVMSNGFVGVAEWFEANGFGERMVAIANRLAGKVADNKGFWGHGTTIGKGVIPSLVAHLPSALIDAERNRYMTVRDCLRIMKLPDDFDLATEGNPKKEANHICQNVPMTTATDMMNCVISYLNGSLDMMSGKYVRQNNKNGQIEVDPSVVEKSYTLY
jgi:site-specific DNA-cytosine methylase